MILFTILPIHYHLFFFSLDNSNQRRCSWLTQFRRESKLNRHRHQRPADQNEPSTHAATNVVIGSTSIGLSPLLFSLLFLFITAAKCARNEKTHSCIIIPLVTQVNRNAIKRARARSHSDGVPAACDSVAVDTKTLSYASSLPTDSNTRTNKPLA